ncbi:phage tail protein [Rhizobium sp. 58]|nr:phage tail protein [Rhizobium sp. 58]
MSHWTDRYIGLPHLDLGRTREGCDCYGLARIIFEQELGISLPDYRGYANCDERNEITALISGAALSPMWAPVAGQAAAYDIALFNRGRYASHIGIVASPGLMVHMAEAEHSRLEHYRSGLWSHRLVGHYRHVDMVSRTF